MSDRDIQPRRSNCRRSNCLRCLRQWKSCSGRVFFYINQSRDGGAFFVSPVGGLSGVYRRHFAGLRRHRRLLHPPAVFVRDGHRLSARLAHRIGRRSANLRHNDFGAAWHTRLVVIAGDGDGRLPAGKARARRPRAVGGVFRIAARRDYRRDSPDRFCVGRPPGDSPNGLRRTVYAWRIRHRHGRNAVIRQYAQGDYRLRLRVAAWRCRRRAGDRRMADDFRQFLFIRRHQTGVGRTGGVCPAGDRGIAGERTGDIQSRIVGTRVDSRSERHLAIQMDCVALRRHRLHDWRAAGLGRQRRRLARLRSCGADQPRPRQVRTRRHPRRHRARIGKQRERRRRARPHLAVRDSGQRQYGDFSGRTHPHRFGSGAVAGRLRHRLHLSHHLVVGAGEHRRHRAVHSYVAASGEDDARALPAHRAVCADDYHLRVVSGDQAISRFARPHRYRRVLYFYEARRVVAPGAAHRFCVVRHFGNLFLPSGAVL